MYTINAEPEVIAQNLKIDKRIEQYNQKQSLKDHRENFKSNPKCRLIYPAKSEIGIVSKEYIDNINKIIREKKKLTNGETLTQQLRCSKYRK